MVDGLHRRGAHADAEGEPGGLPQATTTVSWKVLLAESAVRVADDVDDAGGRGVVGRRPDLHHLRGAGETSAVLSGEGADGEREEDAGAVSATGVNASEGET